MECASTVSIRTAVNSLAPGKFECNLRHVIFKQILVIDSWGISCEIAVIWMSLGFTDDQSTLVEVMAWCRQATGHYLSQCWPRSQSPYGVTRPYWVLIIKDAQIMKKKHKCSSSMLHSSKATTSLSHFDQVTYGDIDLDQHWLGYWLVSWRQQAMTMMQMNICQFV